MSEIGNYLSTNHMNGNQLGAYAADRVKAGVPKEGIREELTSVGWSEEEADAAYREGLISLGVPLPTESNRPALSRKSSAADIVLNLFSFILLGIVATALGILFFGIISEAFPDQLDAMSSADASGSIHYSIAALLIAFPLYAVAMRMWFRKFREDEGRVESKLSKWLTYLVLLAASVTIVGDLITTVFTLLQGEITVRFFLKAITILAIAGAVFGFYFLERRRVQYKRDVPRSIFLGFGWVVAGFVAIGIVLGFFAGGSPETARNRAFDAERASDLSSLASCIESYASDLGQLPSSLSELRRTSAYSYCSNTTEDPETGKKYEYRIVTASIAQGSGRVGEYELCATFSLPGTGTQSQASSYYDMNSVWSEHGAGRECDTMTAQLGTLAPVPAALPVK